MLILAFPPGCAMYTFALKTRKTNFAKHANFAKVIALVMGDKGTRDSDLYGVCEHLMNSVLVALAHVPLRHATAGALQHLHISRCPHSAN